MCMAIFHSGVLNANPSSTFNGNLRCMLTILHLNGFCYLNDSNQFCIYCLLVQQARIVIMETNTENKG